MIAVLDDLNLNIEYGYASPPRVVSPSTSSDSREAANAEATFKLEAAGFKVLKQGDL